ncbi:MAG: S1 RNA-binding domain-containing protein, partial [Holophagales bacterium]|nr:S1 RNA-binding domain-containing protein [Holophagales bacterium]
GLVHLSEIGHQFIKRPSDALTVGQPVRVKVVSLDHEAKRIGLSIKALLPAPVPRRQARPPRREGLDQEGQQLHGERPPRRSRPKAQKQPRPRQTEGQGPEQAERRERPQQTERPERPRRPEQRTQEERPPKPKSETPRKENQPPPTSATLDDLMAKFNRRLR